jgi:hypothetical protein
MSANIGLMLPTVLSVLRKNAPPSQDRYRRSAYREGLLAWKTHYCTEFLTRRRHDRAWRASAARAIARHAPGRMSGYVVCHYWRKLRGALKAPDGLTARARDWLRRPGIGRIRFGSLERTVLVQPDSDLTIECHYVARFLESVRPALEDCQTGTILFDKRFQPIVESMAGLQALCRVPLDFESQDAEEQLMSALDQLFNTPQNCLFVVQCLSQVYDLAAAMHALAGALLPGGLLLATVPGCALGGSSQVHCYRRFTPYSLQQLASDKLWAGPETTSYGNVLVALSALHGVAANSLRNRELSFVDPRYPLTVGLRAHRTDVDLLPASPPAKEVTS